MAPANAFPATEHSAVDSYNQNYNQVSFWRTGQLIVVEVKVHQPGQLPNLGRDGACQRIFGHKTISGRLVYQPINLSKKVLTSQFVPIQLQVHQGGAEAEFRRNVACAARRSFLVRGTLVYHAGHYEHKTCVPVKLLTWR